MGPLPWGAMCTQGSGSLRRGGRLGTGRPGPSTGLKSLRKGEPALPGSPVCWAGQGRSCGWQRRNLKPLSLLFVLFGLHAQVWPLFNSQSSGCAESLLGWKGEAQVPPAPNSPPPFHSREILRALPVVGSSLSRSHECREPMEPKSLPVL